MKEPVESTDQTAPGIRRRWLGKLFPGGTPKLWCPPLTHYDAEGAIDRRRIGAHLKSISPWVKGLLVPGSTGDGWELTSGESREVLEIALEESRRLGLSVLAGALRPVASEAKSTITQTLAFLKKRAGVDSLDECLLNTHVCGFAVCPPRGRGMEQKEMGTALSEILTLGIPTAVYQLPQITENELSPELAADLAERFGNFILFKDTSGTDVVAKSGCDLRGVFMVRGAEGGYARHLKTGGGAYDGFLLSTANGFARELHQILTSQAAGRPEESNGLSDRLSALVDEIFRLVRDVPAGNAFANAGKAADHFRAYGPKAAGVTPPRLHAGSSLPVEVIRATGDALSRYEMMPAKGYLE